MKHLSKSIVLAYFLVFLNNMPLNSQIINNSEAINTAEIQLMLTQRVAKDYLILGINKNTTTAEKAKSELKTSVELFEQNHLELIEFFSNNNNIYAQLENIYLFLELYKDILNSRADIIVAASLLDLSTVLKTKCEAVIMSLKETANIRQSEIINISSRQRVLSQQIALYCIGNTWGVEYEKNIKKEYTKSKDEFRKALKTLSMHKENTELINNTINIAQGLLSYETKEFELNEIYIAEIYNVTNDLHEKMDVINKLYVELDKK